MWGWIERYYFVYQAENYIVSIGGYEMLREMKMLEELRQDKIHADIETDEFESENDLEEFELD